MGRYLVLWEADESKIPLDAKERQDGWLMATAMVREDMKAGLVKDYGVFLGQPNGFTIAEGKEEDVINNICPFSVLRLYQLLPLIRWKQR